MEDLRKFVSVPLSDVEQVRDLGYLVNTGKQYGMQCSWISVWPSDDEALLTTGITTDVRTCMKHVRALHLIRHSAEAVDHYIRTAVIPENEANQ